MKFDVDKGLLGKWCLEKTSAVWRRSGRQRNRDAVISNLGLRPKERSILVSGLWVVDMFFLLKFPYYTFKKEHKVHEGNERLDVN